MFNDNQYVALKILFFHDGNIILPSKSLQFKRNCNVKHVLLHGQ